jgi:AraC-like DNA-binding protein
MHCHDCYEIEVVAGGSGSQVLNGRQYALEHGCITLLSPADFHSVTPSKNLYIYNFLLRGGMLPPRLLHAIWAYDGNKFLRVEGDALREIISICEILEWEHHKQAPDRAAFMKNLMECFFMLILRALPDGHVHQEYTDSISRGITYLHQHFQESPSLQKTASLVGLNPDYFSHRFHQVTGSNYTAYLTRLKLSHAKKLLLTNRSTVTDVCFSSGFTSISNFMKVFKAHTGMSPKQYARDHNKDKNNTLR